MGFNWGPKIHSLTVDASLAISSVSAKSLSHTGGTEEYLNRCLILTCAFTYVIFVAITRVNINMNITPAESVVMEALWHKHPRSAEDIVAELQSEQPWQEATIKTLLNRLLKKRAIAAKKQGRHYLYWPRIERNTYLFAQSSGVIDRLFGGRVTPLVAHFSEHRKLSRKDVDELKRLIQEIERGE